MFLSKKFKEKYREIKKENDEKIKNIFNKNKKLTIEKTKNFYNNHKISIQITLAFIASAVIITSINTLSKTNSLLKNYKSAPTQSEYSKYKSNNKAVKTFKKQILNKNSKFFITKQAEKFQTQHIYKFLNMKYALKIGNGPIKVIEFANVDCPYCRKMEKFLYMHKKISSKITRYIFFIPIIEHPKSFKKTFLYYGLSNKLTHQQKIQFIQNIMIFHKANKIYKLTKPEIKNAKKILIYIYSKAMALKIKGFPTLYINNQRITGYHPNKFITLVNHD
jgi:hypothetical protein